MASSHSIAEDEVMRAIFVDRFGTGSPLRFADVAKPEVGDDDVLVEVHAASLNQLDAKIKSGEFRLIVPYRPPFMLGHDVSGTIVAVGQNVKRFRLGDAIYARARDGRIGTLAEYIAIHQDDVALKPVNLSFDEAASIPLVGLTAWQALVERGRLQAGQKVFIQAGSSGVGTIAIQLAKHLGATVATTAGKANARLVRELGADVVIDYRNEDFEAVLADYDLVINSQDAATLAKSLRVLKRGGAVVSISGPPDPAFARQNGLHPLLHLALGAVSFRVRRAARRAGLTYDFLWMTANGDQLKGLTSLIELGALRPVVDSVFPFEQTSEALACLERGRAVGKVVVTMK
jgi:NADPH:quinone reductase-like Zn-dependent oxidoreductase